LLLIFFCARQALSVADFKALAYSEAHRPPSGRGARARPVAAHWARPGAGCAALWGARSPAGPQPV